MSYKLGKTNARPGAVKLKLKDYLTKLPSPPKTFGHESLIKQWQMLGNDQYGDCVFAGAAHETMLWNAEASKIVNFTDSSVLSDYSALTGFNPDDPNSDQGTDMEQAASYRLKTGVVDDSGNRHKIAAYLAITPGDVQEHLIAAYLFGAVGIGIQFPDYAFDQFDQRKPWTYHSKHTIEGGHYIPLVGRITSRFYCVSWGKLQPLTDSFFRHFNDESIAYVSEEFLKLGVSPEGFDLNQLRTDLKELS